MVSHICGDQWRQIISNNVLVDFESKYCLDCFWKLLSTSTSVIEAWRIYGIFQNSSGILLSIKYHHVFKENMFHNIYQENHWILKYGLWCFFQSWILSRHICHFNASFWRAMLLFKCRKLQKVYNLRIFFVQRRSDFHEKIKLKEYWEIFAQHSWKPTTLYMLTKECIT